MTHLQIFIARVEAVAKEQKDLDVAQILRCCAWLLDGAARDIKEHAACRLRAVEMCAELIQALKKS